MVKKFEEFINEDYFSKLANRKDNGNVRIENEITEDLVESYVNDNFKNHIKSIVIRKENNKSIVDIDGDFIFVRHLEETMPFQFGKVTGDFDCSFCKNLTSLNGCPQEVGGGFSCSFCKNLTSLNGCPQEVYGNFCCSKCGKNFTVYDVKSLCNVKGKIYV